MIQVNAKGPAQAEVLIFEQIGEDWFGDGLTAKSFAQDLKKIGPVDQITVRINSVGGSVTDGVGIYNALKEHGAHVTVVVEGLAASIASVIAMAGDKITMLEGSLMMIHSPWSGALGNANDMRKAADILDKFESGLVDIYAKRTGQARAALTDMLAKETWFDGKEAVEKGFADEAENTADEKAATALNEFSGRYAAVAKAFRKPADVQRMRIAASLIKPDTGKPMETTKVTEQVSASAQSAEIKAAAQEAARAALAADQTRRADIRGTFGKFSGENRELLDTCLDDPSCSADAASKKLLAVLGERHTPTGGVAVVNVADARDKFLAGAENAILARAGVEKREAGNEFNGMRLAAIAERALNINGVSTKGWNADQIARKVMAGLSTSDFPTLINLTANKSLLAAYQAQPSTWQEWCKKGEVSDFKVNTRLAMGSFGNLLTIPEGSEYKQGVIGNEYNTLQAATKGRYIQVTRQMIVNDDLNAFSEQANWLGAAARRTVESDVYTSLVANPAMADGGTLFNATVTTTAGGHANYVSSGTAITAVSLSAAKQMYLAQKDASNNDFLSVMPKYLLVSPAKEMEAWTLLNSTADLSGGNANPAKKNWAPTMNLTLIVSPYLTGNTWYLLGDNAIAPVYEVAFLNGNDTPYTDEEVQFLTDAMRMKVRLDYGVAPINWRAAFKNAGA